MENERQAHPVYINLNPMKQNIRIAIPTPCHEKWNQFTPTAKGGFCSSCQKEVIDFTTWNEEKLKVYFKTMPTNSCGKFRKEQLKVYSYTNPQRTPTAWLSVVLSTLLMVFSARSLSAQVDGKSAQRTEQFEPDEKGEMDVKHRPIPLITEVKGVVKANEGEVLPGVNVLVKGTQEGTVTDEKGRFSILVNPEATPVLVFSFIGFETVEYQVDVAQQKRDIDIQLNESLQTLGEIVVGGAFGYRWFSPRRWWWGAKALVN